MDESTLLYQEGEPDGDRDGRQVVLQLPEGCDTSEGVIMQIQGDNIHIITQGCELGDIPLGIAMESDRLMDSESAVAGPSQLAIGDSAVEAAELGVAQHGQRLTVVDRGVEVEEEDGEEPSPEDGGQLKGDVETTAEKGEPESVCFVCSAPCRRPCRLLLTRAASSGVSLAERLGSLLPLRLHCSASDGVCDHCRQLVEQADEHHTQFKSVELRVRQLFCLEERMEEEERRQEQEQEEARLRQETLERRRQEERRRQKEHREDAERRRTAIERRLKTVAAASWPPAAAGTELFPFAADDDFDSGGEGAAAADPEEAEAVPPPPPPPPPPVDDLQDEDWTPRKRYSSRRRRQPRRPWSPDDPGAAPRTDRGRSQDRAPPEPPEEEEPSDQRTGADPTATEDPVSDQQAEVVEDQTGPSRDPDGVPTTTIEFVSFNAPQRRGRGQHRLLDLGGGGQGRQRAARPPNTPNFYCRRCDTTFDSSGSLVQHITTSHTRPWCRRCRAEFDSVSLLNQHRRHCRSQCNLCGLRPNNMAQHLRSKHPRSAAAPAAAADTDQMEGDQSRSRPGGRRRPAAAAAAAGPPTVIEFRDVKTLREQVKNVKTPRFSLKFRRASTSDLEKIQHLSVGGIDAGRLAGAVGGGRPAAPRLHTCLRCGEQLDSLRDQVEHLHTVHKGKSWCRRCKTEFPNKRANLDHRADCMRQNYEGDCPQCGKHVKYLKLHMRTHESSNKRRRESVVGPDGKVVSASLTGGECHICNKFIAHRLKRHVASHAQHPCPICKKLFSREDVIAGHIKRVHMKERPHICNHCGKGFVSLYSMQRHEMIHTNSYRFYCQECGDGFRQKQQLTTHMRHKHGVVEIEFEDVRESAILGAITDGNLAADVRFYCQECGSGFHSRRLLTAHMRIKHGVANVVFEDVQLHVAGTIEQLEAVTVAAEETTDQPEEPESAAVAVDQLTGQDGDPTGPGGTADGRRDWWDPDRATEAY